MINLVKIPGGVIYWDNELQFTYDVFPQGWEYDGNNQNFIFAELCGSAYGFPIEETTIDDLTFNTGLEFINYLYS
jgi:hypothetical protein